MGTERPPGFVGIEEAVALTRADTAENHKKFGNTSLVGLMGMLGFDRQFVRAQGTRVWDSEGNEYLDFVGGYGALNLGHNHPRVMAALEKVKSFPNILQTSIGTISGALMRDLALVTPDQLSHTFLCNSGAEAVEGALKLARAASGRTRFVYCENSFHGKTFGALSVTGRSKYRIPFEPLLPGCSSVPFGDLAALEKSLKEGDIAAFIVEPIQGEGGIVVPPPGYLRGARELCSRYEALFIADEIQTGLGRTGAMFAVDHDGVEPDVMCLSKSLSGGVVPIGAFVTSEKLWMKAFGGLDNWSLHTSTFGGNTFAAACAISALETLIDEDLSTRAREKGDYLIEGLLALQADFPLIKEVRGRGLLVGIEFEKPTRSVLNRLTGGAMERLSEEYLGSLVAGELVNRHRIITVYTLNNPNVIRLEPPLIVTKDEIDRVQAALREIFSRYHSVLGFALGTARSALGGLFKKKQ